MRSSSAAKWLCPCGVPWHSCNDHRGPGFTCGSKPRLRNAPKARSSRKFPVMALGCQRALPNASFSGLRPPISRHKEAARTRARHTQYRLAHASVTCSGSHENGNDIKEGGLLRGRLAFFFSPLPPNKPLWLRLRHRFNYPLSAGDLADLFTQACRSLSPKTLLGMLFPLQASPPLTLLQGRP